MSKGVVILIPGVGDAAFLHALITLHWQLHGIRVVVFSVGWATGDVIETRVEDLLKLIKKLSTKHQQPISLVGTSAGGSFAINTFIRSEGLIHSVVCLGSRLKRGDEQSFSRSVLPFPRYTDSVLRCEGHLATLSKPERKRILTMRSGIKDVLVPGDTAQVDGAMHVTVPVSGHVASITAMMTIYSRQIVNFIKSCEITPLKQ